MQRQLAIMDTRAYKQNNPSGGAIGHLITKVFGCWHRQMSRPFSSQGQTYRSCLHCGARRQFNVKRWEMQGNFYFRSAKTTYLRAA